MWVHRIDLSNSVRVYPDEVFEQVQVIVLRKEWDVSLGHGNELNRAEGLYYGLVYGDARAVVERMRAHDKEMRFKHVLQIRGSDYAAVRRLYEDIRRGVVSPMETYDGAQVGPSADTVQKAIASLRHERDVAHDKFARVLSLLSELDVTCDDPLKGAKAVSVAYQSVLGRLADANAYVTWLRSVLGEVQESRDFHKALAEEGVRIMNEMRRVMKLGEAERNGLEEPLQRMAVRGSGVESYAASQAFIAGLLWGGGGFFTRFWRLRPFRILSKKELSQLHYAAEGLAKDVGG